MRLTKRLLAMLLTVVMVLSMLPAIALTASAASSGDTFEKITSLSDLSVGDEVIFVNSAGTYAMSTTQNSNNRGQTAVSASSGTYTYSGSSVQALTVEAGSTTGTYAFYTGSSGYLYSPSANNYLRTKTTKDSTASWTITANANGTFHFQCAGRTAYYIQYNSGSSIFSCYKNTMADFCIYKKAASKTLSSIAVTTSSHRTFAQGATFVKETITATYSDTTTADVTNAATFSGYNMNTAGTQTVSVSYTEGGETKTTSYSITVQATPTHTLSSAVSPSGGGSVSLSKTTVAEGATATATATANTGYTFTSWSISGTGASLSSTSANPTTVTMGTANATVTANFTAKTPAGALTLSEAGNTTAVSVSDKYVGDKVNLPNDADHYPSDTDYNTFIGWYAGSYSHESTAPSGGSFYAPGAQYTLTGSAVTLKAVYAKGTTGGSAGWYKVSSAPSSGSIVIVSHGDTTAMKNAEKTNNTSAIPTGTVTISGNEITSSVTDYSFTFESGVQSGYYRLVSDSAASKYLKVLASGKTAIKGSGGATDQACDIKFGGDATNGFTVIGNTGSDYLTSDFKSSGTAGRFDIYQYSSGGGTTYSYYQTDFKSLTSIALSGTYPTSFTTADTFSHDGMVVTATYSDSSTENVTSSATWSSPNMSTTGTKDVTVSYTYGGNTRTATYTITVNAPTQATLSYNGNGSTGGTAPQSSTVNAGNSVTVSANTFTRTGYTFSGWNTDAEGNGTSYSVGASITLNANVTLYAQWTINTHSVTVNAGTGGSATASHTTNVPYGTEVTLTASPNEGYTFTSWSATGVALADNTVSPATFSMPDNDVTITATFTVRPTYTLTYSANGATTTESPSPYGGDTVTLPSSVATPPTGYTFVGWLPSTCQTSNTAPSGLLDPGSIYTMPNENTTLYAVYALGGGGTNWEKTDLANIPDGKQLVIVGVVSGSSRYSMSNGNGTSNAPAAAAINVTGTHLTNTPGSTIIWTLEKDGTNYSFKTGENYLYATNTNNGVRVGSTSSSKVFTEDDGAGSYLKITTSNTVRYIGVYNAADWRCYESKTGNIANQTFEYYMEPDSYAGYTTSPVLAHSVTAAVSPAETGTVSLGAASVGEGSTTTATANPAAHYHFDHWTISGTGASLSDTTESPTTITMGTADVTVTAYFVADTQYTLTYSVNGNTSAITAVTDYAGEQITLPASNAVTPPTGYTFMGWLPGTYATDDTAPTGMLNPGTNYTMPAVNTTLYAVFAIAGTNSSATIYQLTSTLEDGEDYIFVSRNSVGTGYVLAYDDLTKDGFSVENSATLTMTHSVAVSSGSPNYISDPENSNYVWTAHSYSGGESSDFALEAKASSGDYFYATNKKLGYSTPDNTPGANNRLRYDGGLYYYTGQYNRYIYADAEGGSAFDINPNTDNPTYPIFAFKKISGGGTTYSGYTTAVQLNLIANDDTIVIDWALPVTFNVLTNDEIDVAYTMTPGTLPSGVVNNGEGSFTYTPSSMQQNNLTFTYTLTGNTGSGETSDQATVTLKVADTVYYEEGNSVFTYDGDWTEVSAGSPVSSLTDIPSDIPGYEAAYASYSTYSGGKAKKTTVSAITSTNPSVTFTFAGTGFDVISATTVTSGTIMVTVKDSGGAYATYPGGGKVNQIIDTYRGYSYSDGEWTPSHNASANYYQIPIIRATGLTYGTYTVEVKLIYSSSANHTGNESYDFFFDGVRIYNPVSGQAAEYKYLSIRDAVAAGGTGSGTVTGHSFSAWLHNENSSPSSHTRTCTDDGCSETETALCSFTSAVTTQPTGNTAGVRKYTCSGCGYFYTESIDPTGFDATYYVNGVQYGETEHVAYNGNPTFPTPSVTSYPASSGYSHDYVFQGWVAATISSDTATPGTIYTSSSNSCTLSADTSFYAVFKYNDTSAAEGYRLSNSAPAAGDTVILAIKSGSDYYALPRSTSESASWSGTLLEFEDGAVSNSSTLTWEVEDTNNSSYPVMFTHGSSKYFKLNSTKLAYTGSGGTGYMKFTASGDGFTMENSTPRYLAQSGTAFGVTSTAVDAATVYVFKNSSGGSDYYATTVSFASHDYEATITPGSLALHPTGTGTTGTVSATLTDNNVEVTGVTPTYTSSDTSVATVAADGTVTAVANGTATITATYTVDGDDYSATCAVTVTTLATYNVTYYVNGDQYGQVESVTQGDSPSFTAPSTDVSEFNAHRYEFAGWKEASALSDDTSEAPTLYTAGSNKPISAATSFYAVYKYVESDGTVATQAMDLTNGNSGTYVIAANVDGTYYALPNSLTVTSNKIAGTALASVPGSTMTTSEASGYALTIAKSNDVWTIGNSNVKITYSSDSTNIGTSSNGSSWTIVSGTHGSYRINGQSGRALAYRNGNNVFGHYSTNNITAASNEYYDVEIIPVVTGTTYYATTLNYAATHTYAASMSSATLTIEAGEEEPVFGTLTDNGIVTNAYTPVYTSSNTSVATVDSNGYVTGVAAGSATITVTYTVDGDDYSATCAVTVTAAQTVTTYTVTYYVNGSQYTTESVAAGGHPGFTAPSTNVSAYDAHSYSFAGWAAATVSETTTAPTTYTNANASSYTVGNNASFYAVYTWSEGGSGGTYDRINSTDDIVANAKYLIVYETESKAMDGSLLEDDLGSNAKDVTIDNGSIASNATVDTYAFTYKNSGLQGTSGRYIYGTNNSNATNYSTTAQAVTIAFSGNNATITSNTSVLRYNTTNNGFRYYKSSSTSFPLVQLYKYTAGAGGSATNYYTTTLEAQSSSPSLTVTPTSLTLSTGGYAEIAVTALNGGAGAYVTATSTNTGIANVYALNDGNNTLGVSAGGTGSATITVRYFDSSANQLASETVSVTVSSSSGGGSVGTNADYGRVGSDGNAPTTSGSTNAGTRGTVCTSISQKAADYYSGKNTTWATLTALAGVNSSNSVTAATNNALMNKLRTLMTLTTTVSYSSLTGYWATTDKSNGGSNAHLFYSMETSSSYNREHVWPKSKGQFYESGAGSDLHHLRPTDSTINSTRGNHTMGYVKDVVSGYSTKAYNSKTVLWYSGSYSSNDCDGLVEVLDGVKGDVARILLYVYTEYPENTNLFTKTSGGGSGNNASNGGKAIESRDTLLKWCALDPVDTWEMSRNDAVQTIQGNRNVYIDYPELAWMIFNLTPPSTMQTPSGQASVGNVGTRDADTTNYGTSAVNNAAIMSEEPAPATRGATRSIEPGSVPTNAAIMIDGLGQTNVAADIEAYGPKFGIYLAPSQGIVFTLQSADTTIETLALQLGAKAVNGAAGQIDVAAIGSASGNTAGFQYLMENQAITSATEMYYALDGDKLSWESGTSSVIVIYNSGTDVVAITNLRYPATNTLTMSISNSQVQRAVRMIREVYGLPETDPDPINDAPELDFRSASLALNSDIAINFYVDAAVYESIDAPYAVFTKALYNASGEVTGYATTTVSAATLTDNGYCFSFTGIRPDEMGSAVTAKLYGYRDGTLVEGDTCSYSVLSYVNRMANSSYANNADFRTLLADLVSYGAAAQTYTGYNTANLATAGVSADLMTNATAAAPSLTNRTAFAPNENESVSFVGAYLTLRDKVTVCYTIDVGDYDADALELLISYTDYDGTPKTVTIYGEDFTEANGLYVASFSELNAVQMRTVLSAEVFANGSCVSSTLTYSIESYAQSKASGGDALAALVNAMMKFGDSAMTYFAEEA